MPSIAALDTLFRERWNDPTPLDFHSPSAWVRDKLHGEVIPVPTTHLNYTRPEPYGTVAVWEDLHGTPWDLIQPAAPT